MTNDFSHINPKVKIDSNSNMAQNWWDFNPFEDVKNLSSWNQNSLTNETVKINYRQPIKSEDIVDKFNILKTLSTKEIENMNQSVSTSLEAKSQQTEKTRSKISLVFIRWFFVFLGLSVVWVGVYNIVIYNLTWAKELFLDMSTLIPLIGSVVWTPLWFVMWYYFKDEANDNK